MNILNGNINVKDKLHLSLMSSLFDNRLSTLTFFIEKKV